MTFIFILLLLSYLHFILVSVLLSSVSIRNRFDYIFFSQTPLIPSFICLVVHVELISFHILHLLIVKLSVSTTSRTLLYDMHVVKPQAVRPPTCRHTKIKRRVRESKQAC